MAGELIPEPEVPVRRVHRSRSLPVDALGAVASPHARARSVTLKKQRAKKNCTINVVKHALDILEQFGGDVDELGITDLSTRLKLDKNKVFRLLATLESRNFIEQKRATDKYRLGSRTLLLGQTFLHQMGLYPKARPVQEALAKRCKETCYVSIMKDWRVVYLHAVESDLPVRVVPRVGSNLPFYCTAAGKVIAASICEEKLKQYLPDGDLRKSTPNSIDTTIELKRHLRVVAESGFAVDDEEAEVGVICIAAPIKDHSRRVVGALSIAGPSMRFSADRLERELIPLVREAAREISTKLGY